MKHGHGPNNGEIVSSFLGGILLGCAVFLVVYGGKPLDVTYDTWIFQGLESEVDLAQHYLGWELFRHAPWTFPIGMTPEYAYPHPVSIIYADVIPICAVCFKLLSPLLPATFQYFGLWGILCYALQGGLAAVLLRRFLPSAWLSILCALFFLLGMPIMYRMFGHTALASQWILLLALVFLFYGERVPNAAAWRWIWIFFGGFCVWVHAYFVPMVFAAMLCFFLMGRKLRGSWRGALGTVIGFVGAVLASMGLLGGFSSGMTVSQAHVLGLYNANLNAFFNPVLPMVSRFLPVLPWDNGQYEGYAYLGLGGLLLLAVALGKRLYGCVAGSSGGRGVLPWQAVLLGVLLFLVAIFPTVRFGDQVLLAVEYPAPLAWLMSAFRANGRFLWIPLYLLLLSSIAMVAGEGKRSGIVVVLVLLGIQIADFSACTSFIQQKMERAVSVTEEETRLLAGYGAMDEAMKGMGYLCYTDWHFVWQEPRISLMLARYAQRNGVKLETFYLARAPEQHLNEEQERIQRELAAGEPREDTLYVIADRESAGEYRGLHFYEVGDILLGSKKTIPSLESSAVERGLGIIAK